MIDKILDNYYARRLIDKFKMTQCIYGLDFKNEIEKDRVLISCKIRKYKNYTKIIEIPKKYCFYYLSHYKIYEKDFVKTFNDYYEKEKNNE